MARGKVPADPRGGHIRLYWGLVDSVAWRALSWAEKGLYLAMRRKLSGSNNGNIDATLGTLRHAGITSSASLAKGLRSLMTAGFIAKTRQGGVAYGAKVCSLYRFTDEGVFDFPKLDIRATLPTNDWRRFSKLGEVRAALKAAHEAARRPPAKNAAEVQPLKCVASRNELEATVFGSTTEATTTPSVQRLKQAERA